VDFAGNISKNKPKIDLNRGSKEDAERLVSAGRVDDDAAFELKLRPTRLQEFIAQTLPVVEAHAGMADRLRVE